MPTPSGPGDERRTSRPTPARRPRPSGSARRSFLSRHLGRPGAVGIVVVVLVIAVASGFTGALVWAGQNSGNLRQGPPVPPPTIGRLQEPPPPTETTSTTKPDLPPDALAAKLAPSVWSVATFDSAGQPVRGAALVAGSADGQGLLVTSLAVVEASTHQVPEITVTGPGFNGPAVLWTWDDGRDLALLVVPRTGGPVPPWVVDPDSVKVGDPVFAVGAGRKLTAGVVTAKTASAVAHNVFIDDTLRGGPLVNQKGEVVALSSAVYTGGGRPTDTAFFAVPIAQVCASVLRCGSGRPPAAGPAATTTTRKP
jgi:S1-C subfamily serine protease